MFLHSRIVCGLIIDCGQVAEMPYNQQQVIILVGNVGTGKTTWTRKYLKKCNSTSYKNFVALDSDSISTMLSGIGRYYWQESRKELYSELKKVILNTCLKSGYSVIIDGIHATRKHRKVYIDIAHKYEADVIIVDFGPGNLGSLERRYNDNRGLSKTRWKRVHRLYQDMYEMPSIYLDKVDIVYLPYEFYNLRRK